ncbi:SH3 domain-containing protein [Limoniibacter endophyticus]|uniref:SH3b domain-containing protein n=1 Tax=Limoniibacter endophyticus TaxID=1565040 RepID=A0A8J3DNQ4_9HYPH|nr:SH3 domain-containing protein [Limoniibacter endophyticus]GHC68827.1 hypothetical protein GCM10010136_13940 [Limoniibacter endophyticus]
MRKYLLAAATAFGLLVSASVASAEPAVVTGNVNVRTGPGTGYSRIATIQAGSEVEILRCTGNWCQIELGRLRGWMSANYLDRSSGGYYRPVPPPPPPIYDPRPPYWDRPEYRPPYWDRPGYRPPRPRPPHWDRPDRPRPPDWNGPGRPDRPRPPEPERPRPPQPERPTPPRPGQESIIGRPPPDDAGPGTPDRNIRIIRPN